LPSAVPKTEQLVPTPGTSVGRRFNPDKSQSSHCQSLRLTIEILARALHNQLASINPNLMQNFESTYALLVRSEEKKRNVLEIVVYALFILSAVFSIWQFAHQTAAFPIDKLANATVCATEPQRS
jgi:hypothetical protein